MLLHSLPSRRKWVTTFYFLLAVTSSAVGDLSLFMNETETRRLLGVPGELYYVRNGFINDYALSFNQLLSTDITEIYFNWFDESSQEVPSHKPQMEYSMSVAVSNMHAMYQPRVSIPMTGVIPTKRSGFSLSVMCTGLLSTDVELRIQINITTAGPYKPISLNVRRKKPCLRGIQQAPRPVNRQQSLLTSFASSPPGNYPTTMPSLSDTTSLAPDSVLDDSTSSVIFYASVGGALGSVIVMATVVIVCYLLTSNKAKEIDNNQRHTKMVSGDYETGTLMSNKELADFAKPDDSSKLTAADDKLLYYKICDVELAHARDDITYNVECSAVLESVRIEPCRIRLEEVLIQGKFSAVYRGQLVCGTYSNNELIEDDVLVKTFISDDFPSANVNRLELMARDCYQMIGLSDDYLSPARATSCFSLGYPHWLVYNCAPTEQCLQTYFDQQRVSSEAPIGVDKLLLLATQLTSAVHHLHRLNIVHRDIAARNCTIDTNSMTVRLTDCALSADLYPQYYCSINGGADLVPVKWAALELLASSDHTRPTAYSSASDVWSLGVAVWELMTLCLLPYAHVSDSSMYSYILQGHRLPQPLTSSSQLYSTLLMCWLANPAGRPSASHVLASLQHSLTSYRQ